MLAAVKQIPAATIVTPSGLHGPGSIVVDDDGLIVDIEPTRGLDPTPTRILAPGFIDLQVNGVGPIDIVNAIGDDWDDLDTRLLTQGVTTWCPTLVSAPLDRFAAPLERIAAAAARSDERVRPVIAGAHLEGPFLGGAPGAHPLKFLQPPDLGWLEGLPDIVRVVTLAPETTHALDAIRLLTARGMLVSLGHSTATYEQALAAIDAGARLVTHCFNGMGPLHHRQPGLIGAALTDDRVAVSLITDLVHVHPAAIALAFRSKSAARVALVTDAVAWEGEGDAPRLPDGTLMGSTLTADAAIRNVVQRCGVSLVDAVRAAATTPADLLGLPDRGRIEPGARADLVALNPDLTVETTWVLGQAR
ncbi:MAG: N-acetylgalactosamine-6-phosphate deacetylase [Acidimicrobiaceae bacterium]|jgi:N-acetylglucosamine-6-phosphate deacetylase